MGYETICLDVVAGYDPASLELSDQALPIELHDKRTSFDPLYSTNHSLMLRQDSNLRLKDYYL